MLPQFKGFAVGDGCLGTKTGVCGGAPGPWWDVLFLYGHGQISTLLWDELIAQCTVDALKHGGPTLRAASFHPALLAALSRSGGLRGCTMICWPMSCHVASASQPYLPASQILSFRSAARG